MKIRLIVSIISTLLVYFFPIYTTPLILGLTVFFLLSLLKKVDEVVDILEENDKVINAHIKTLYDNQSVISYELKKLYAKEKINNRTQIKGSLRSRQSNQTE